MWWMMNTVANNEFNDRAFFMVKVLSYLFLVFLGEDSRKAFFCHLENWHTQRTKCAQHQSVHNIQSKYPTVLRAISWSAVPDCVITSSTVKYYYNFTQKNSYCIERLITYACLKRNLLTISSYSLAGSTSGSTGTLKIGLPFAKFTAVTASNSMMLLISMFSIR